MDTLANCSGRPASLVTLPVTVVDPCAAAICAGRTMLAAAMAQTSNRR